MSALIKFQGDAGVSKSENSYPFSLELFDKKQKQPSDGSISPLEAKFGAALQRFQTLKDQNQLLLKKLDFSISQSDESNAKRQFQVENLKQRIKNSKETLQTLRQLKLQKLQDAKQKVLEAYKRRSEQIESAQASNHQQILEVRSPLQEKQISVLKQQRGAYLSKVLEMIQLLEHLKEVCAAEKEQQLLKYTESIAPFNQGLSELKNHEIIPERRDFYSVEDLFKYREERPKSIEKAKELYRKLINQLKLNCFHLRQSNAIGQNISALEKLLIQFHSAKTHYDDNPT